MNKHFHGHEIQKPEIITQGIRCGQVQVKIASVTFIPQQKFPKFAYSVITCNHTMQKWFASLFTFNTQRNENKSNGNTRVIWFHFHFLSMKCSLQKTTITQFTQIQQCITPCIDKKLVPPCKAVARQYYCGNKKAKKYQQRSDQVK